MSDIEIARAASKIHIRDVAAKIDIPEESLVPYGHDIACLLYTSPSPRDQRGSRMPSSA